MIIKHSKAEMMEDTVAVNKLIKITKGLEQEVVGSICAPRAAWLGQRVRCLCMTLGKTPLE